MEICATNFTAPLVPTALPILAPCPKEQISNKRYKELSEPVHPLDVPLDQLEKKFSADALGPMVMTKTVRISLLALRLYLIIMGLLCFYHVLDLAGVWKSLHN